MKRLVAFLTLVTTGLLSNPALASVLENLRNDLTVPEHCRTTHLADFDQNALMIFTVGPMGGSERGFDYEYPLLREHASWLFRALHGEGSKSEWERKIRQYPHLWEDYTILRRHHMQRDFHFEVEGEVLELLAIIHMQRQLDAKNSGLYVSGSVEYHGNHQQNTIGELDMIVGDRINCQIVAYGEVKLGLGSLSKARAQVRRFFNFLHNMGLNPHWDAPDDSWFDEAFNQDRYAQRSIEQVSGM
ncbi:MAG: hypothetical protein R2827_15155 [Bdellovibrionales bacterium]